MNPSEPAPDEHSVRRFTNRADDYARFRPAYPSAAIDAVLAGLAPPERLAAADVGAGTGISARLLAERGVAVTAIEPNAAMRAAGAPHPRVAWRDGTAEATGLADRAVDLVLCAQAFHWFAVEPTLREFQRILKPNGRLALVWNRRSTDDPFAMGYRAALEAIDGEAPAERSNFDPAKVTASGRFGGHRLVLADNATPLTFEQLRGRALSTSTVPREGPRLDRLLGLLRELHARHADAHGVATMRYRTQVHLFDAC